MTESLRTSANNVKDLLIKESDPNFDLRLGKIDDISELMLLVNSAYLYENEGEKSFKKRYALRTSRRTIRQAMEEGIVIVATNNQGSGDIIGCFQYKEIPASEESEELNGYFGMLAVDTDLQRRGVGRSLVQMAEVIARWRGRNAMQIQVVNHSQDLLDWYSRRGYQEYERIDWEASFLTKPSQFVLMSKPLK